jgi:hypothetical protein
MENFSEAPNNEHTSSVLYEECQIPNIELKLEKSQLHEIVLDVLDDNDINLENYIHKKQYSNFINFLAGFIVSIVICCLTSNFHDIPPQKPIITASHVETFLKLLGFAAFIIIIVLLVVRKKAKKTRLKTSITNNREFAQRIVSTVHTKTVITNQLRKRES